MRNKPLVLHFLREKWRGELLCTAIGGLNHRTRCRRCRKLASYLRLRRILGRLSAPTHLWLEKVLRKICAVSFITFVFSTVASAQLPSGGNAFFGYSYVHGQAFSNSRTVEASGGTASMSGWETSVEGKYLPWLGVVADLDWHYGGHDTVSCLAGRPCTKFRLNAARDTLMFGPRASTNYGKYRPFAEFLLGLGYQSDAGGGISNSDLTLATAFGGGVDYSLVRSVSLRAQAHSVHTTFFGQSQYDFRLSSGIVFRF
jgi:hypothetical protein